MPQEQLPVRVSDFFRANLFQIVSLGFFVSVLMLLLFGSELAVEASDATIVGFAIAAISYAALLFAPQDRFVRVFAVLAPLVPIGIRLWVLVGALPHGSIVGLANWLFIGFVFAWAGPRLMPPPLTNGERRAWLSGGHTNGSL